MAQIFKACFVLSITLALANIANGNPQPRSAVTGLIVEPDSEQNANLRSHFLRSLRAANDASNASPHFLRALRSGGSHDLQRILRSDSSFGPDSVASAADNDGSGMAGHFLRSLRASQQQPGSQLKTAAHDFMRMIRAKGGDNSVSTHFLRSLRSFDQGLDEDEY